MRTKERGFKGQLKLDITRLERRKAKVERRIQKLIKEVMLINNLIEAMNVARNPKAVTPATEAAQVAAGTQQATAEIEAALPKKDESNVQAPN